MERLSDVPIVAGLFGAEYLPWRTRAGNQARPNQAYMGQGTDRIAEDRAVLLHREVRP